MPDIHTIDLRRNPAERGRWISPPLIGAVNQTLEAGERACCSLTSWLCAADGLSPLRPSFPVPELFNMARRSSFSPRLCAIIAATLTAARTYVRHAAKADTLAACGPGVERLAEEVAEVFPDKRAIVLSSDFPGGTEHIRTQLQAIAAGEVDIVIGTQLVAKGP